MKALTVFKQTISDVFTLKSETLTIFLGTFIPFFAAHIFAYSMSKAREILMKKEPRYFLNFFAGLWVFFIFYGLFIIAALLCKSMFPGVPNFFISLPFIVLAISLNLGVSLLYYPFYKKNI